MDSYTFNKTMYVGLVNKHVAYNNKPSFTTKQNKTSQQA